MQGWETLSSTHRKNRERTLAGKWPFLSLSLSAQGVHFMLQRVNEVFLFFYCYLFIYFVSLCQPTVLRLQLCIITHEMKASERITSFAAFILPSPDHL